jgi:hypothetical protein
MEIVSCGAGLKAESDAVLAGRRTVHRMNHLRAISDTALSDSGDAIGLRLMRVLSWAGWLTPGSFRDLLL